MVGPSEGGPNRPGADCLSRARRWQIQDDRWDRRRGDAPGARPSLGYVPVCRLGRAPAVRLGGEKGGGRARASRRLRSTEVGKKQEKKKPPPPPPRVFSSFFFLTPPPPPRPE